MPTYPKKTRCMADGGKVKKLAAPPPTDGKTDAKAFLDGLKSLNADVKAGKVGTAPGKADGGKVKPGLLDDNGARVDAGTEDYAAITEQQDALNSKARAEGRYGVNRDKTYMSDKKLAEYNKTRDLAESKNFPGKTTK
jgi:hypothetical protein